MIDYMTQFNLVSRPLERYMRHYLSIIMCISSVISVKSGQKEHLKMRKELWKYLYDSDKRLYRKIRHNITSCAVNLPGYVGRKATIAMYKPSFSTMSPKAFSDRSGTTWRIGLTAAWIAIGPLYFVAQLLSLIHI